MVEEVMATFPIVARAPPTDFAEQLVIVEEVRTMLP
jgi:hypothetical protein